MDRHGAMRDAGQAAFGFAFSMAAMVGRSLSRITHPLPDGGLSAGMMPDVTPAWTFM
jgi:hypothetical protein